MISDMWILRDGTRVHLGGVVDGESVIATHLRDVLKSSKTSYVCSEYGFITQLERLNVDVPHLLDSYLRRRFEVKSGPRVRYPVVSVPAKAIRGVVE